MNYRTPNCVSAGLPARSLPGRLSFRVIPGYPVLRVAWFPCLPEGLSLDSRLPTLNARVSTLDSPPGHYSRFLTAVEISCQTLLILARKSLRGKELGSRGLFVQTRATGRLSTGFGVVTACATRSWKKSAHDRTFPALLRRLQIISRAQRETLGHSSSRIGASRGHARKLITKSRKNEISKGRRSANHRPVPEFRLFSCFHTFGIS